MGRSLSHRGKLQQNGEAGWFRRLESFCCLALVARPTSLAAGTEPDRFFLSRKRLVLSCAFTRTREISQIGTLATTVVPVLARLFQKVWRDAFPFVFYFQSTHSLPHQQSDVCHLASRMSVNIG